MRRFNIGDKIRCYESGVRGICVKFYTPTACEEQTMVETADGRFYHAPTRTWEKTDTIYFESLSRNIGISSICDSIYGGLQKNGKHMVMARRKREIKCEAVQRTRSLDATNGRIFHSRFLF